MAIGERAMSRRVMHEEWETPASIFDPLHAEFGFTLDAAALPQNAKVSRYFVPSHSCDCKLGPHGTISYFECERCDGLVQSWKGHMVWLNPPYGYKNLAKWMEKAWRESQAGCNVVALVPAHTGQPWWGDWVWGKAADIRWIRGKVKFVGAASCAPFPSCLVIYRDDVGNFG